MALDKFSNRTGKLHSELIDLVWRSNVKSARLHNKRGYIQ